MTLVSSIVLNYGEPYLTWNVLSSSPSFIDELYPTVWIYHNLFIQADRWCYSHTGFTNEKKESTKKSQLIPLKSRKKYTIQYRHTNSGVSNAGNNALNHYSELFFQTDNT